MSTADRTGNDRYNRFLTLICLVLVVLVLLLARQNIGLKRALGDAGSHGSEAERFQPGDAFGSLVLIDDAGQATPFDFGGHGGKTLVLVFTPKCPACQKTVPVWSELLGGRSDSGVEVIGVQLDRGAGGATEPLPWPALPFPVFGIDHADSTATRKLGAVPGTFLVDGRGVVEKGWYGTLSDGQQAELRDALNRG